MQRKLGANKFIQKTLNIFDFNKIIAQMILCFNLTILQTFDISMSTPHGTTVSLIKNAWLEYQGPESH